MKGLAPHTLQVFEAVSKLDCIKPYLLVGGTALSLQMGTRQSEDLDFMKWRTSKTEKMEVAWYQIEKELAVIGDIQHKDILDIDHVEYLVSGVKFSFYACPKYSPVSMPVEYLNNLRLADVKSIGAMKMEVMLRRSRGRKINCVMRRFFPSSSVGDRPAPRGCTSTPDERKVTTI